MHAERTALTPAAVKREIRKVVAERGHKLGAFTRDGLAICERCGVAMVDTDARDFIEAGADTLGSFNQPCGQVITLRKAMQSREGDADDQIRRGRRVWAVERYDENWKRERVQTGRTIVFGTCRSDALRRAEYGARLGESHHGTDWRIAEITTGWDEPFVWPLEARD